MHRHTLLLALLLAAGCKGDPAAPPGPPPTEPDPELPAPLPETYQLRIIVTGDDPDRTFRVDTGFEFDFNYTLAVPGEQTKPLNGHRNVRLLGVRHNCTEERDAYRPIVVEGNRASVEFVVHCRAINPVRMRVTVDDGGVRPQPLALILDHDSCEEFTCSTPVGDAPLEFSMPVDSTLVTLDGVPGDCAVAGGKSALVWVPSTGVLEVRFTMRCPPAPFPNTAVEVTVLGTGSPRPATYSVFLVPGGFMGYEHWVEEGESVSFSDGVGRGYVSLEKLPDNCVEEGGGYRLYQAQVPASLVMVFSVHCS